MYLSSMLRTGRKHWYWVLAGVVATVLLGVAAAAFVPAEYEAQASVVVLPAKTPNGGENPLLGIGGLQPTADTLARAMTDSVVQDRLTRAGATGKYEVVLDPISKGPVLVVTADGPSPGVAITTLRLVVDEVQRLLKSLQTRIDVPTRAQMSTAVIAQDDKAGLVLKSRIRLLGAVIGIGAAFTFGLLVYLESRDQQRAGRKAPSRPYAEDEVHQPAKRVNGIIAEPADRRWLRERPPPHWQSRTGVDDETVRLRR
jgi:hypothetical protein